MTSLTAQEVKVKVGQRGTTRASATKVMKSTEAAMAQTPPDIDKAKASLDLLKGYCEKLDKLNEAILPNVSDENLDDELQRVQQYQDEIGSCIASIGLQISNQSASAVTNSVTSPHSTRETAPKLPKLEIGKFSGDPLLWEQFWDNFEACIDYRSDLPVIDKFKYLKSFLDGEALRMADGYRLTVANYQKFLQALKERFGDPEMAIFAHFEALIALPAASYKLGELRGVLDSCESHIRSLVALDLPETTFGVVFTPLILSKLPRDVKMELYRKNGSQKWTLANLRTLLKEEISAREKCARLFATKADNSSENESSGRVKSPRSQNSKKTNSSSSLLTSPVKSETKRAQPVCAFCANKHYSGDCKKYPDLNSRRKQLRDNCFCCLRSGHNAKDCRSKKPCYYCKRDTHNQSLCPQKFGTRSEEREETLITSTSDDKACELGCSSKESNLSLQSPNSKAIPQTALADVKGQSGQAQARLYFDTGGSRSFISTAMAEKIGAKFVGEESVSIGRFRDSRHSTITYRVYELDVCLPNGKAVSVRMSAERTISCPIQLVPIIGSVFASVKLAEPPVTKATLVPIDILVGNDYYYTFIGESQLRCPNGVVLLESPFGFVAGGNLAAKNKAGGFDSTMFLHASTHAVNDSGIERFWSLEQIGIKDDPYWTDGELALQAFNDSVTVNEGRYSVKWPWKEEVPQLDSNYALARGRLKSLMNRIGKEKDVLQKYDDTISDQLKKGIVELAAKRSDGREHYLPHHCVTSPTKTTTKLRVVYDASAKSSKDQASLNECLHRGPVFLSNLAGILIRWRLPKVALVSDIEKAFLQVGLQLSERDVTRFLWLKDLKQPLSPTNLQILRFCRVPFGVISSPFLLSATLLHHLAQSPGNVANSIQRNIYVDNVFGGASNDQAALDYYREAKSLPAGAKMNLREWFSNSQSFLDTIAPQDRGTGSSTTVLGLKWDIRKDQFSIPVGRSASDDSTIWTKRKVLQALASVFDPLGLLSPVTITAKMLMQELWKTKCSWDDPIPEQLVGRWKSTLEQLFLVPSIMITRRLSMSIDESTMIQLHCFCDASKSAYAAAVYLRIQNAGKTTSDLLFAKSRVAPVKPVTIPRLELVAVVIGVRILAFVRDELDITVSESFVWTDSSCTLSWIANKPVSTTFVRNRLREVKSHSDIKFGYVPSSENPADMPSRGASCLELKDCALWWHGPDWLTMTASSWPQQPKLRSSEKTETEVDCADSKDTSLLSAEYKAENYLIDAERCSDLQKLLRVTAYCIRFALACRSRRKQATRQIGAPELVSARKYWDSKVQECCFRRMLSDKKDRAGTNLQRQLGLFLDSVGLIRCRCRYLGKAVAKEEDCPVLLPKNHPYTDLVIMNCHTTAFHAGVKHTLAKLRTTYWVVHSRNQIKRVLKNCRLCKFYDSRPFRTPDPSPLPVFRVQQSKPFDIVGIDYLGPLLINDRRTNMCSKVWICLFTCATIRAVHLDVIGDLSTEQFLLCYRRFVAMYGRPRLIISDNAKQFHAANRLLARIWKEIVQSDVVQSLTSRHETTWKFITELAPWMGGFYERLVGLVKVALKKSIHNKCLTFVELQTLLCEIGSVLNTRPLLYSEESGEHDYLSPSHFLLKMTDNFPTAEINEEYSPQPVRADELILKWRRIQAMLDAFWRSWRTSYLQSLQDYLWKPKTRNTNQSSPKIGDVVIVKDNATRGEWKLGVIIELIRSHDGVDPSAIVRTSSGTNLRRAIRLLTPIESSRDPAGIVVGKSKTTFDRRIMSTRTATKEAKRRIQQQLADEDLVADDQ